jgi:hypothetical protein
MLSNNFCEKSRLSSESTCPFPQKPSMVRLLLYFTVSLHVAFAILPRGCQFRSNIYSQCHVAEIHFLYQTVKKNFRHQQATSEVSPTVCVEFWKSAQYREGRQTPDDMYALSQYLLNVNKLLIMPFTKGLMIKHGSSLEMDHSCLCPLESNSGSEV